MTWNEWEALKHGDKIQFTGKWNPKCIGQVDEIYVDREGNKYIVDGDSLFPLDQFSPYDYEKL